MNARAGSNLSVLQVLQVLQAQLAQGSLGNSPGSERGSCSAKKVAIAFSGGLDSHVLLHALHALQQPVPSSTSPAPWLSESLPPFQLRAIHIHHGLSPHAEAWLVHCETTCQALAIPLTVRRVEVRRETGQSLEEEARKARYAAFASLIERDEHLLLAHHQDDQAETLLLRLLRGAGAQGLGAMPVSRPLGEGTLWRPLLTVPRSELEEYAHAVGLRWITDESNQDTQFDRNFLRQRVLPVLAQRWPGYRQSWQRSAQLSSESHQLARDLAEIDLQHCGHNGTLNCSALASLSALRQRNLIRYWLVEQGMSDPGWQILRRCVEEVVPAREDAQPLLTWDGQQLRRYRNHLYALHALPPPGEPPSVDVNQSLLDGGYFTLRLPGNGELHFTLTKGQGLRLPLQAQIAYRDTSQTSQTSQTCQLANRRTRPLKKILHEAKIPPWLRPRLPLLQINGQLACIPDVGCTATHAAAEDEPGVLIHWHPPH